MSTDNTCDIRSRFLRAFGINIEDARFYVPMNNCKYEYLGSLENTRSSYAICKIEQSKYKIDDGSKLALMAYTENCTVYDQSIFIDMIKKGYIVPILHNSMRAKRGSTMVPFSAEGSAPVMSIIYYEYIDGITDDDKAKIANF